MQNKKGFPFAKQNYVLMLVGVGVVMLGFLLMALDSEEFGFGILGLTIGPVTVLAGFVVGFFAIMMKPKSE
ncbi:DUF3098 domain-containing protein [Rhodoflexus caldus]|jgi:hypothetical protein|uniref:DUF3098 domain-containing protein n=1 Tax=Rhodoflexus caldus TaxID=2891236 RepID=UPI00202A63A6|nr:DUF3098 domain-containing protein [Rhodoflexus caldus]